MKRYQNIELQSNRVFSVKAYTEPNTNYTSMETEIKDTFFTPYEGYFKSEYRQNRFSPNVASEELAMLVGEDMRANALTHEMSYEASEVGEQNILFSVGISGVIS